MLEPFRTSLRHPLLKSFFLFEGPRMIRLSVPGVEERKDSRSTKLLKLLLLDLDWQSAAIKAADARAKVTILEKDGRQFRTSNIGNNWVGGKGSEYAWYT